MKNPLRLPLIIMVFIVIAFGVYKFSSSSSNNLASGILAVSSSSPTPSVVSSPAVAPIVSETPVIAPASTLPGNEDVNKSKIVIPPTTTPKVTSSPKSEKKCSCPYKVITIAGTKSDGEDAFSKWIEEDIHPDINLPLNNGDGDLSKVRLREIKNKVKKEVRDGHKVLLVGYSLGGSVAQNIGKEFGSECVEVLPIDPPNTCHASVSKFPKAVRPGGRLFDDRLNQICKAEKTLKKNPNLVNWTNGTASPSNQHDPFQDEANNKKKLDDLKKKIEDKINSCKDE